MAENNGHAVATAPIPVPQFDPLITPPRVDEPVLDVKPADFFHAFRRRGTLCIPIAILFAIAAAAGAWFAQKPLYESTAILRLSANGSGLVFDGVEAAGKFELFQGTQRELAKTSFVMMEALRDPEVSQLSVIQENQEDAVQWLKKHVDISTPDDTEIMTVTVTSPDQASAPILADAVVNAYMTEVVNRQLHERTDRLGQIEHLYDDVQNKLRRRRQNLAQLADEVGTSDRATLSVNEQQLVGQLNGLREKRFDVEMQQIQAGSQLEAAQSRADGTTTEVSSTALRNALTEDSELRTLRADRAEALRFVNEANRAFKNGLGEEMTAGLMSKVSTRMDERIKMIEEEMRLLEPIEVGATVQELTGQVATLNELHEYLEFNIQQLEEELGVSGGVSFEVETLRADVQTLERNRDVIAQKKSELEVELKSQPRVQVYNQADESVPANQFSRIGLSGLAGFAAFMVPISLILFMDVQSKKVNSSQDLVRFADLNIVGTVPLIPAQAVRHLANGKRGRSRYHYWQTILAESVNRIASGLLMESTGESPQMILVTSAVGGEGKTTLSTQLAMSLARAGRSVVLVDIDLRRPMIHRTFGLPEGPGVCEALRGEIDLAEAVQPTGIENLSAVSAGCCDRLAIRLLGHESTASLLKELRALGDFVIVDGCPVLPLADTGYICPHVDSVLFAVRRDVSRVAQVRAAHDFVAKCGIEVLGAVVTEGSGTHYRDDRYYLRD